MAQSTFRNLPGAILNIPAREKMWPLSHRDYLRWRDAVDQFRHPLRGFENAIWACVGGIFTLLVTIVPWFLVYGTLSDEEKATPLFYWFGPVLIVGLLALVIIVVVFWYMNRKVNERIKEDAIRLGMDMDNTYSRHK